jgi:hypothetical protein
MKIDRNKRTGYLSEEGRAQQVHRILEGRKTATAEEYEFSVKEVVRGQEGTKMYVAYRMKKHRHTYIVFV